MERLRRLLATGLVGLATGSQVFGQDYRPEDFLPLVVGNSWTFRHEYYVDGHEEQNAVKELTITITGTETVNQHTYYVFSGPDYDYPPLPYFVLAGKRVRWNQDGDLMELRPDGEVSLFRLVVPSPYAIAASEGDTLVHRYILGTLPPRLAHFSFQGHGRRGEDHTAFLLEFYGLASHSITVALTDYSQFHNMLKPIGAILNGRAISYQEARHYRPTAAARTSWGNLKSRTSPR